MRENILAAAIVWVFLNSAAFAGNQANPDAVYLVNPTAPHAPVDPTVAVLPTGAATATNQTTANTEIGGLTETAPASDTASSGLNGRLQRIAQRITSLITAIGSPLQAGGAVSVSSSALPTGAASSANQDTVNTEIGGLTETAPATDTASSGLNGRLQRIAQRLTTIVSTLGSPLQAGGAVMPSSSGATGSAPPSSASYLGANGSGATGGQLQGLKICDQHASYDASTNGSTKIVTGVSGRKVYICGLLIQVGGTATNVKVVEGTGSNCGTGSANITPAYQLPINGGTGFMSPFWSGMQSATNADDVCINASAGNAVQADLWYTIQ